MALAMGTRRWPLTPLPKASVKLRGAAYCRGVRGKQELNMKNIEFITI
jgi:hypothetical protein